MIEALLLNTIKSLIVSNVQSLAADHVQEAIDSNFSEDQKAALDAVVDQMPDNDFKSFAQMIN